MGLFASVILLPVQGVRANEVDDGNNTAAVREARSITQHGITWTFDREYPSGQFINGDYWVVGPVTVTEISPGFDGAKNGSVVDVVPGEQGYDAREKDNYNESATVKVPLTLQPSSSLISTVGLPDADISKSRRVFVKTAAVLSVLEKVPPKDAFRPAFSKGEKRFIVFHN